MTMIWVANGVVVGGLALILTLDASVQEFTEEVMVVVTIPRGRAFSVS